MGDGGFVLFCCHSSGFVQIIVRDLFAVLISVNTHNYLSILSGYFCF